MPERIATDRFLFWFTVLMAIVSVVIIADSTAYFLQEGWTLHRAVLQTLKDIGATLPAVAGIVAFTLNARRLVMSAATYIEQQTAKVKEQVKAIRERREQTKQQTEQTKQQTEQIRQQTEQIKQQTEQIKQQQIADGLAKGRAWNERRLEAKARGEPFDEPFPGDEL